MQPSDTPSSYDIPTAQPGSTFHKVPYVTMLSCLAEYIVGGQVESNESAKFNLRRHRSHSLGLGHLQPEQVLGRQQVVTDACEPPAPYKSDAITAPVNA